jgi:hypothetical protein
VEKKIAESPFVESKKFRFNFSLVLLLVLMVIAVGGSMLLLLVMRVPAFTSELRAYMGKTELVVDPEESRRAHLVFLMYLYASPLGLGIIAYGLHHLLLWLNRATAPVQESDEFIIGGELSKSSFEN